MIAADCPALVDLGLVFIFGFVAYSIWVLGPLDLVRSIETVKAAFQIWRQR